MKYAVVHTGTEIIAVQEHIDGNAIATQHRVIIDTKANLITLLAALSIPTDEIEQFYETE